MTGCSMFHKNEVFATVKSPLKLTRGSSALLTKASSMTIGQYDKGMKFDTLKKGQEGR